MVGGEGGGGGEGGFDPDGSDDGGDGLVGAVVGVVVAGEEDDAGITGGWCAGCLRRRRLVGIRYTGGRGPIAARGVVGRPRSGGRRLGSTPELELFAVAVAPGGAHAHGALQGHHPGQIGVRIAKPDKTVIGEQLKVGAGRLDSGPAQDRPGSGVNHDDRPRLIVRDVKVAS